MSNTLLSPTKIVREALRVAHQKLNFIGTIDRQYDSQFAVSGAKIGSSLTIRMPNKYTVTDGAVMQVQDTAEESQTLTVATRKHVAFKFSDQERTLNIDDFSKRYIEPAMSVLCANVEYLTIANLLPSVYNVVSPATATAALDLTTMGKAHRVMVDNLAPRGKWYANLQPQQTQDIISDGKALFHSSDQIQKQYLDGMVGRTAGFDFFENTLWPRHVSGAAVATTYRTDVAAGEESGANGLLHVDTGTGAWALGDVITVEGVYRVHPETKVTTSELQQFVITAVTATGEQDLPISPSMIASGAKQNVSNVAGDGKIVTKVSVASKNFDQGLAYHKEFAAFVTADLDMPKGVDFAARDTIDGISMRIVQDYNITNDERPCRIDILFGSKALRPEWAVRIKSREDA
jgi:hypothetical protein